MAKQKSKKARRDIVLDQTALGITSGIETVPIVEGFSISVNGLTVDGTPEFEQWDLIAKTLRVAEKGAPFAIGDLALNAKELLGEKESQLWDATEWSYRTVEVYRWIASRIDMADRRMDRLGIRHHLLVAALSPAKQQKWLTKAAADDEGKPWTVARLKAALEAGADVSPESYGVFVIVPNGTAQDELMSRLEAEGLSCKAVTRHAKKPAELTDGDGEV